ncbi:MAG: nuclear transport factor 2 family protein [Acetobacteraceae bacterium]
MTDHTAFIQSLYAAFGRGDLGAVLDACDPAVTWTSTGDPATIPWAGTCTGTEGVRGFFAALLGRLDYDAFEPREFFPSGDSVVVLGHARVRGKASGGDGVASDWVHIFTTRDGKLVRFHEFYDTASLQRALRA